MESIEIKNINNKYNIYTIGNSCKKCGEKDKKDIYIERDRNYIIYTIGNSCKKTDNSG